ncbi:hypothetical protein BpHYR1_040949 [Brachionus plicatilis]|uniref:Uncharacterized protein n=1 Tax=Brachionus plicatilis TaxID=10195 RepID=A0A3M7TAP9_BRAPC|nr:hypothetical protein BpHYR1_040949 [Brachionus plicatilis]
MQLPRTNSISFSCSQALFREASILVILVDDALIISDDMMRQVIFGIGDLFSKFQCYGKGYKRNYQSGCSFSGLVSKYATYIKFVFLLKALFNNSTISLDADVTSLNKHCFYYFIYSTNAITPPSSFELISDSAPY